MSALVPVHESPAPDVRPRWIQAAFPRALTRRARRHRRDNVAIGICVVGIVAGLLGAATVAYATLPIIVFISYLDVRDTGER